MAHQAHQVQQGTPPTTNIFPQNYSVTGIRAYPGTQYVLITGSCPPPSNPQPNTPSGVQAMLYSGLMPTHLSEGRRMIPPFITPGGKRPYSSIFYGPNTPAFFDKTSSYVRAVGTYNFNQEPSTNNLGMLYQGPAPPAPDLENPEYWRTIEMDVPNVINTIPHSTMGDLIVGNYQVTGQVEGEFGAFVCRKTGQALAYRPLTFTVNGVSTKLVTAYGIWQNNNNDYPYTIAGGCKPTGKHDEANVGYLLDYNWDNNNPVIRVQTFKYHDAPSVLTHFEGITQYGSSCYSLAATGDDAISKGAAFAVVKRNSDNSFPTEAQWQRVEYSNIPGTLSGTTTGNTVLTNDLFGVYIPPTPPGGYIQSYVALNIPVTLNCP